MSHIELPKIYLHEILDPLGVQSVAEITLEVIQNSIDNIPLSTNVAHWRFHRASNFILMESIWRFAPLFHKIETQAVPSEKFMVFSIASLYRKSRQYASTNFKRRRIQRKVVMPIQAPTMLQNFEALVLTTTPQSSDAGKISELAIGTEIDKDGYVTKIPERALSLTSSLCPFPQRMAANREVVMCALSQAISLQQSDKPIVYYGG
jgi:hypothetical protein